MTARLLVLPSPLLGPAGYQPLADALRGRGHDTSVARCREPIHPDRLVAEWSEAGQSVDVLVAHSNAGYLAATVAAEAGVDAVLFMDAALPPATGPTRLAPPELFATLADLAADDGSLPPWTRWWPAEEMAEILPAPWFDRVDAAAPRLSLEYFETEVSPPPGWSRASCAYLAFGTTYAAELAFAREAGWPVAEVAGHHLWHLARPAEVAAGLDALAGRLPG
ncbi:MAG TPA: alpha/beta fold hydrolase [Nocardioides sp.]|nr:alpha/beta fold hydrolase [Nocardioides sp.]